MVSTTVSPDRRTSPVQSVPGGSVPVRPAPRASGPGRVRRLREAWPLLGPAFVAAVAYVDPGNFATNFAAGGYGYALLWVIVGANLMAMLIQSLTAKLGLVTGRDLASLCREELPRPVTWGLWVQAEAVAVATDLAEVVGGAIALQLLFGVPLPVGGVITALVAFALLGTQRRGQRPFECVVAGLLGVIGVGFLYSVLASGADAGGVARGMVPGFPDGDSVLLATGIIGATVMPHVIYVHSALAKDRYGDLPGEAGERVTRVREVLRHQRLDVVLAMGAAGLVNAAMLVVAAKVVPAAGSSSSAGSGALEDVHAMLGTSLGGPTATAFAVALLASGLAASSVGTYAGQVVMEGFLRRHVSMVVRRGLTLAPALVVLFAGVDPTAALVWSQVVLSFGIPFALVPLIRLTGDRTVMGVHVDRPALRVAGWSIAVLIIVLNSALIVLTLTGTA